MGLVLGDASLYKTKTNKTSLKFEYSSKYEDYAEHLHYLLKDWTFSDSPSMYMGHKGTLKEQPSSFFFYTFSHASFNVLWDLFMLKGKKSVQPNLVLEHLSEEGFAYWVLDDGSYHKSKGYITLHTEGFTYKEVCVLSKELNQKFHLNTKPLEKKNYKNKQKPSYWIIYIPKASVKVLYNMPNFCKIIQGVPSLAHKLPSPSV